MCGSYLQLYFFSFASHPDLASPDIIVDSVSFSVVDTLNYDHEPVGGAALLLFPVALSIEDRIKTTWTEEVSWVLISNESDFLVGT